MFVLCGGGSGGHFRWILGPDPFLEGAFDPLNIGMQIFDRGAACMKNFRRHLYRKNSEAAEIHWWSVEGRQQGTFSPLSNISGPRTQKTARFGCSVYVPPVRARKNDQVVTIPPSR